MISYGNVLYGDMPKTASSYIIDFLNDNLRSPRDPHSKRHGKVAAIRPAFNFCFVSVREPISQYISLYRYGCDGKGGLHGHLKAAGLAKHYYTGDIQGFETWMEFMLSAASAKTLDARYADMTPRLYGFMTFRYLLLAVPAPVRTLRKVANKDELRAALNEHTFVNAHVKTERLRDDMLSLCEGGMKPFMREDADPAAWLNRDKKKNKSKAPTFSVKDVAPKTLDRIREKEWFLYEALGY